MSPQEKEQLAQQLAALKQQRTACTGTACAVYARLNANAQGGVENAARPNGCEAPQAGGKKRCGN